MNPYIDYFYVFIINFTSSKNCILTPVWWWQAWFWRRCAVLARDAQSVCWPTWCQQQDHDLPCCYQQSNTSLKISLVLGKSWILLTYWQYKNTKLWSSWNTSIWNMYIKYVACNMYFVYDSVSKCILFKYVFYCNLYFGSWSSCIRKTANLHFDQLFGDFEEHNGQSDMPQL